LQRESDRCDGILDETASQFIFGPEQFHKNSLYDLVTKAQSITIAFYPWEKGVEVFFFPRPGKANDTLFSGFMTSFFACDFSYDPEQAIWVLVTLCANESDRFQGSDDESSEFVRKTVIDLNGGDAKLPITIWRPKK